MLHPLLSLDESCLPFLRSLNRRLNHIESNVVTLARNIDYLRSQIRGESKVRQELERIQQDMNEIKDSFYNINFRHEDLPCSHSHDKRMRSLDKLKRLGSLHFSTFPVYIWFQNNIHLRIMLYMFTQYIHNRAWVKHERYFFGKGGGRIFIY